MDTSSFICRAAAFVAETAKEIPRGDATPARRYLGKIRLLNLNDEAAAAFVPRLFEGRRYTMDTSSGVL